MSIKEVTMFVAEDGSLHKSRERAEAAGRREVARGNLVSAMRRVNTACTLSDVAELVKDTGAWNAMCYYRYAHVPVAPDREGNWRFTAGDYDGPEKGQAVGQFTVHQSEPGAAKAEKWGARIAVFGDDEEAEFIRDHVVRCLALWPVGPDSIPIIEDVLTDEELHKEDFRYDD